MLIFVTNKKKERERMFNDCINDKIKRLTNQKNQNAIIVRNEGKRQNK